MSCYRFGEFSLDPEARVLFRKSEPVPLQGKTLDTLIVLVQNHGRLVDKDELLSRVWPGTAVEEGNLTQSIFTLRKTLGDSPKHHRYIATVAGRGYQFVAPVADFVGEPAGALGFLRKRQFLYCGAAVFAVIAAAALWFASRRSPERPPEFAQQRLTYNSNANSLRSAAISPDGRYLAYSDPSGIHIKVLATGDERLIPRPLAIPADAAWYVDSWFPDGAALLTHSDVSGKRSIWTTSVVGQSSRKLRDDASGWSVSPDGMRIAFSPAQPFRSFREIWMMGSSGEGAHRIVAAREEESLSSVHWSPDGQKLSYIRLQVTPLKICQAIETCDRSGANRKTALPVPSKSGRWIEAISWLPNGRIVYSQVESLGSDDENLWEFGIDARTGNATSQPKRITRWPGSAIFWIERDRGRQTAGAVEDAFPVRSVCGEIGSGRDPARPPTPIDRGRGQ